MAGIDDKRQGSTITRLSDRVAELEQQVSEMSKQIGAMHSAIFGDGAINPGIVGTIRQMQQESGATHREIRRDLDKLRGVTENVQQTMMIAQREKEAIERTNDKNWQRIKLWGSIAGIILGILQLISIATAIANNLAPTTLP